MHCFEYREKKIKAATKQTWVCPILVISTSARASSIKCKVYQMAGLLEY